MRVVQGDAGRAGHPARLPTTGWSHYGLPGDGPFRILARGGSSGEIQWIPEAPKESVDAGDKNQHQSFSWPPIGVLPAEIRGSQPGSPIESTDGASRDKSNRLTGPVQIILKLLEFWRLEPNDAVGLLGFDPSDSDHVVAVLAGDEQFRGRDVRDRLSHLFRIRETLWSLFRDLDAENDWLREPHALLDDKSPLSLLVGGSMEDMLLAREYVDAAAAK